MSRPGYSKYLQDKTDAAPLHAANVSSQHLGTALLGRALDVVRKIANCLKLVIALCKDMRSMLTWKGEREVDSREQDGQEDVPSKHGDDECACATSDEEASVGGGDVARCVLSKLEVEGTQATENPDQSDEDEEEDEVRSERHNHVDEAEHAHEDQDECE